MLHHSFHMHCNLFIVRNIIGETTASQTWYQNKKEIFPQQAPRALLSQPRY